MSPTPVIRVAGLPSTALTRLRCAESATLAEEILCLRDRLGLDGTALSERLHAFIGTVCDGGGKSGLVGLRRAVYGVRTPTDREWNRGVEALLPADVAHRVTSWVSMLRTCQRLTAQLPQTLAAEVRHTTGNLRGIVDDPWFRRAVSYASPALHAELTRWLAGDGHRLRRQSIVRLAKYVARAAAKTSPYSTFTVSGTGHWTETGDAVTLLRPGRVRGVLELNGVLLHRISAALRADPRLRRRLRLRINPSATVTGDTVTFLGSAPGEPIVTIPATAAIRRCLRVLDDGAARPPAEIRSLLDARADGTGRVERFLDRLVELGLVQREVPVPDLAADPLGVLAGWLAANAPDDHADSVALLGRVRSLLRDPAPLADIEGHVERHRALTRVVAELAERTAPASTPVLGPGVDLVRENAVAVDPAGTLSIGRWRPALADLDVVRRVLAVLDPALPLRIALGAYCAEHFGAGSAVPFLTMYEAVARELSGPAGADRGDAARDLGTLARTGFAGGEVPADARLARLRELRRIQADLYGVVPAPNSADGVVRVDPATLRALAAAWPEWITAPASVAWYLQAFPDGDSVGLVVNAAHTGYGRGRSRTLHLIRQAGGDPTGPPDPAEPADPTDPEDPPDPATRPVLAELAGMFGFAPNVRLASLPYEIDYPFTVSCRPARQRIAVNDLAVVHDAAADMVSLVARSRRARVWALHLGMMADPLLPPAARIMTLAFGAGYYVYPSLPLLSPVGDWSVPDRVLAVARVEIGRVVVGRARWIAPTGLVPARAKGEPDAGYLLRVLGWLRGHRIPARSFVRMPRPDPRPAADGRATRWTLDKSRKPVYVDFANPFLMTVFERMLADAGPIAIFEEALPSPDDAPYPDDGRPTVTEFIVELSEPGHGDG